VSRIAVANSLDTLAPALHVKTDNLLGYISEIRLVQPASSCRQSRTSGVVIWVAARQPRIRRENTSNTNAT
jgi:hypothetical protein